MKGNSVIQFKFQISFLVVVFGFGFGFGLVCCFFLFITMKWTSIVHKQKVAFKLKGLILYATRIRFGFLWSSSYN